MTRAEITVAWADTNLFVALFATEEHPGHDRALDLFRRAAEGSLRLIVTPLVVAELVYVTTSVLRWSRAVVCGRLGSLLDADGIEVRESAVLHRALVLYRDVARLDFADAYLGACAVELGPPLVASFDADFDRVEGTTRLSR